MNLYMYKCIQFDFLFLPQNTATFSLVLRSSELKDLSEKEDAYMVEDLVTHSLEPQVSVEPEASVPLEETSQFDRLHPEQDLSHIFKVFFLFSPLTTYYLISLQGGCGSLF